MSDAVILAHDAQMRFQLDPVFHARCVLADECFTDDLTTRGIEFTQRERDAARHGAALALLLAERNLP